MTISIFIPFYNEDKGIVNLKRQLQPVLDYLIANQLGYELLLLDDGSTDQTLKVLKETFDKDKRARFLTHRHNQGLAAAMITAVRHAKGEIFASLDADCTYQPKDLIPMLKIFLKENADLVTASPYHPKGHVSGLPLYRLIPSFTASWIYQNLTGTKIHTFTSMFRIYKTAFLKSISIKSEGFLVFAEIMLKALHNKARIVEYPTILGVRRFNQSKMRIFKTIKAHLGLMIQQAKGNL